MEVANYVMEKREAMVKKTQADVIRNAGENAKNGTSGLDDSDDSSTKDFATKFKVNSQLTVVPTVESVFTAGFSRC